jgi:membrane-associated phospholipid phosphatase
MLPWGKFKRHLYFYSCRPVIVAALVVGAGSMSWASQTEIHTPCSRPKIDSHSVAPSGAVPAGRSRVEKTEKKSAAGFCLPFLAQSFAEDQKAIWSSPFHLHAQDTNWLVPAGVGTLGLVIADKHIMRHFVSTPIAHSNSFSNYGLATMIGGAASLYLLGTTTHDDHARETGFLAGEAAMNSLMVAESMKLVFQRARPNAANAGSFGAGGSSFPSEHAMAAWSMASVVAHEYPGPLTKLLAYGAASGISLARVAAREHFSSDVVVGSALGYLIGRYVYRAHHDPELPGVSASEFGKDFAEKDFADKDVAEKEPQRPRPPSRFASPYVPLDSLIYPVFDRLAALGYAPSAFANLRPWTRMECARIIASAGEELSIDNQGADGKPPSQAYRLYAALAAEFPAELERLRGAGTSEIRVGSIYIRYAGIAGTPLDDSYHFGQTLIDDYGRPYGQGSNLVGGASAWGAAGPGGILCARRVSARGGASRIQPVGAGSDRHRRRDAASTSDPHLGRRSVSSARHLRRVELQEHSGIGRLPEFVVGAGAGRATDVQRQRDSHGHGAFDQSVSLETAQLPKLAGPDALGILRRTDGGAPLSAESGHRWSEDQSQAHAQPGIWILAHHPLQAGYGPHVLERIH